MISENEMVCSEKLTLEKSDAKSRCWAHTDATQSCTVTALSQDKYSPCPRVLDVAKSSPERLNSWPEVTHSRYMERLPFEWVVLEPESVP